MSRNINISSTYGIMSLITPNVPTPKFKAIYRKFIYQTFNHVLAHLFVPNSLFGRGYERTENIDDIIKVMGISRERLPKLDNIETQIINEVKRLVLDDGHDGFGVYEIGETRTVKHTLFTAKLIGDYRILEWEAGRGKDLTYQPKSREVITDNFYDEVPEDDVPPTNKLAITPYSTHIDAKVSNNRHKPLLSEFSDINGCYFKRIANIEAALNDDKFVSSEDLYFYTLHNTDAESLEFF